MKDDKMRIDFKFAKNWKFFLKWHDEYVTKTRQAPAWDIQKHKIEVSFADTATGIVDWASLWNDFSVWYDKLIQEKSLIVWAEQQRQIETLMLNQLSGLNKEQFVLVYLHLGKPEMDTQKMTYWEALRVKQNLEGDKDGRGGNEDMDKITIVNLSNLIK